MLVGQSAAEYALIKTIIYAFSYLGLACLIYFYLALSIGGVRWIAHPFSIAIEVIGLVEILFYLLWFLPYRSYLHKQKPAFPPPLGHEQRQDLFYRSLAVTPDLELFARKWMCGASIEDLRRENLKEWLLWALFDREGPPGDDDEELEEYVKAVEEAMGRDIKPGWGPAKSLRLSFSKFTVSHRTLLYYLTIGTIDFMTTIILIISGFRFYRQPRWEFERTFPLRPMTLLALRQSASPNLSYFYRPHKSTKHRPIVFVHGVGIGLTPYIPLFLKLPKDIGILAIEILPVSSRITPALPLSADLMREIGDIIGQQNLNDFVFIGNSYGTFFTKMFIESSYLSSRMSRIVMIDPVAVLLHLPDVAYNFTMRTPVEANELQLWWAAQTEPDIAFTLGRRFCWREHLVWKEELLSRPTTLIMGGKDCIVNPEAIATYITKGMAVAQDRISGARPELRWTWEDCETWKKSIEEWKGEGLELVWLEGYDHGQGLMNKKLLPQIVEIIQRHCEKESGIKGDNGAQEAQGVQPDWKSDMSGQDRRSI